MKNPKTLKPSLTRQQTKLERRAKRLYALAACLLLAVTALAVPAFAADDPLAPGCKPEAIPRWRDFAVECVDSEQFVRFKQTANKTAAVEKWLDVLYSGLKAVRKECGPETAAPTSSRRFPGGKPRAAGPSGSV